MKPNYQYRYIIFIGTIIFFSNILHVWANSVPTAFAQFKLNDNAANTLILDESSGINNATANVNTAILTSPGKINTAISFNGIDQFVNLSNLFGKIRSDRTGSFSLWIKPVDGFPILEFNGPGGYFSIEWYRANRSATFAISGGGTPISCTTATNSLPADIFSHLVITQDGAHFKIYINGVEQKSLTYWANSNPGAWFNFLSGSITNSRLGSTVEGSNQYFLNGVVDDLRYYRTALSSDDVLALYKNGSGTEDANPSTPATAPTPFAQFKLNDSAANTIVLDESTAKNNVTASTNTANLSAPGKINQSLFFNGTNQFVDAAKLFPNIRTDSIGAFSLWVKPVNGFPILEFNGPGGYFSVEWYKANQSATFAISGAGTPISCTTATGSFPANVFSHLVISQDGSKFKIYLNGVEQTNLTYWANSNPGAWFSFLTGTINNSRLGGSVEGAIQYFFTGSIDDLRYYKNSLSNDDVLALYNNGLGTEEASPGAPGPAPAPNPTPNPTPTPAPTVTLTANPLSVSYNTSTILNWSSTNATSCTTPDINSTATNGTYTTPPLTASTTYTVLCSGPGGAKSDSVTVNVNASPQVNLSAIPTNVGYGGTSTITWSSQNVNSCTTTWGATELSGTYTTPPLTTNTTYTLTCKDFLGKDIAAATAITVGANVNTPGAIGNFAITQQIPGMESADSPISLAYLNDHIAGSRGPITSKDGHLSLAGQRIRLYGIDLSAGATLPNKSDAVIIAARLKKEGFNAARLGGFDRPVDPAPNPGTPPLASYRQQGILNADNTTFNATALDYFDHFIYQLEQNGIYIDLMIKISRAYTGFADCLDHCRGVDLYLPDLIASQKDFASRLLNHVNPYTGKAYKHDPGIVVIDYNNENSISTIWSQNNLDNYVTNSTLYTKFAKPLENQWEYWLQSKYGTASALTTAWSISLSSFSAVTIPLHANVNSMSKQQYKDWVEFFASIEKTYKDDMRNYLKNTLGVTALVYATQSTYDRVWTRGSDDASDIHLYFGDLGTPTGETNPTNGRPVYQIQNKSVLSVAATDSDIWKAGIVGPFESKEYGKPAFITETAYRNGNQYLAEFEPLLTAYAGFNDLDAIYNFSYKDHNLYTTTGATAPWYNSTVNSVTRMASALSFRRGDVTAGTPTILKKTLSSHLNAMVNFTTDKTKWVTIASNFHFGGNVRAQYTNNVYHQVVTNTAEEQLAAGGKTDASGAYVTTTGEIKFKVGDRFTLNSPKTKTAFGFFDKTSVTLSPGIDVYVGDTINNYAVINLTSLNDTEILPSNKMLLTLAGYYTVPGEWPRTPGQNTYSWGTGVPRIESIPTKVRITTDKEYKVTALDFSGARKQDVPVVKGVGYIEFVTGPAYDTGWYLIENLNN